MLKGFRSSFFWVHLLQNWNKCKTFTELAEFNTYVKCCRCFHCNSNIFLKYLSPRKWRSSSALKTGRLEVPGSIPVCRHSRSKFSVVFSETCVNTGYDPLERSPTDGTPLTGPGPTRGQLALTLQPNSTQNIYQIFWIVIFIWLTVTLP